MKLSEHLLSSNLFRHNYFPWLILFVSLLTTLGMWIHLKDDRNWAAQAQFELRTEQLKTAIINRMTAYQHILLSSVGLFNASETVSRDEWHAYVNRLQLNKYYPGTVVVGFSQHFSPAELPTHLAQVRAEGFPNYTIYPEGPRDEYTAIIYFEPCDDQNSETFGYDMFSESTRRAAMEQARDTGQPVISGKLVLLQDAHLQQVPKPAAFIMVMPVYRDTSPIDTVAQRRSALFGYVYAAFRVKELMQGIFGPREPDLDYEIYDGESINAEMLLYDDVPHHSDYQHQFSKVVPLDLAGHHWTVNFVTLPQFDAETKDSSPMLVLSVGLVLSILLFMLVSMNQHLQMEVAKRILSETALRQSEERFNLAVQGANDGVWDWNIDTGESYISSRYKEIIGYADHELCASVEGWQNLIHPEDRSQVWEEVQAYLEKRIPKNEMTYRMRHKDGHYIWVLARGMAVWNQEGKPYRMAGTIMDMTALKQAEETLQIQQNLLRLVIDSLPELIFWKDTHGVYLGCNQRVVELNQSTSPADIIGKTDFELMWKDHAKAYQASDRQVIDTKNPEYRVVEPTIQADGTTKWVEASKVPLYDANGQVMGILGMAVDITARKEAEDLLREYNHRLTQEVADRTRELQEQQQQIIQQKDFYELILESVNDGIWVTDANDCITYINHGMTTIAGMPREQLLGANVREYFATGTRGTFHTHALSTKGTLQPVHYEAVPVITPAGRHSYQSGWLIPLVKQGQFDGMIVTTQDVTEQQRVTTALQQAHERFATVLNSVEAMIYVADMQTQEILFANRSLIKRFGGQLTGKNCWLAFEKGQTSPCTFCNNNQLVDTKGEPVGTVTREFQNSAGYWFHAQERAIRWTDGRLVRLEVATDITQRKQIEEALHNSEKFTRLLIEELPIGLVLFDQTGFFVEVNRAFTQMIGYSLEELQQLTFWDITPPAKYVTLDQEQYEILQTAGRCGPFEKAYLHKDGTLVPVRISCVVIERHKQRFFWCNLEDITEQQRVAETLRTAKEAAELANRAKSTFLANMSHELRTPLNGILGFAQILQRDKTLTPKQLESINIIHRSGEYLLTLINDILDLAKIEAGKIEICPVTVNFEEFIAGITDLFRMRAQQKGIQFNYETLSPLPAGILADDKRLRQVLLNLLGNAVKFTHQGSVTLKIGYHYDKLRFQIEDTGVGIASEDLAKIFEPFQQVGDRQYKAEGTGLGLPITKKLVQKMGGELQVESVLGLGSIFWMLLELPEVPLEKKETSQLPVIIGYQRPEKLGAGPVQLLVIDDNRENRAVLVNLLTPLGFQIIEAHNALEALIFLQEIDIDLIIVDLVMPVMDGLEFTRQIRSLPTFQNLPIIAASASVFETYQQDSLVAGCDAFLAKPIRAKVLLELLGKLLGLTWVYESAPSPPTLGFPPSVDLDREKIELSAEQANILFNLALIGDVMGLQEEVNRLQQTYPQLHPFTQQLVPLVKEFQTDKICELVKPYM